VNTELEYVQGIWNIVELEVDGHRLPSDGSQVLVKGERFTSLGTGAVYEGQVSGRPGRRLP
jgi:hypothetical protein